MTEADHLDISRKLARAIGWKPEQIRTFKMGYTHNPDMWITCDGEDFDYRDPVIAFRVAERYNRFPMECKDNVWCSIGYYADTPQLAIALAVIGDKT